MQVTDVRYEQGDKANCFSSSNAVMEFSFFCVWKSAYKYIQK